MTQWNKDVAMHFQAAVVANKKLSTSVVLDKKEVIRLYELTHPKPIVTLITGGAMAIGSILRKQNLIPMKKAIVLRLTPTA